jgi:hypothetical protein
VLELLAEHRVLVEWHVRELLGVGEDATARRLRRLASAGLVDYARIFEGHPAAVSITRRGLGAIGSPLPAPRLDLKGYRHDVGVGWLWLAARRGAFGHVDAITSERTMRSRDRRREAGEQPLGVGLGLHGPHGGEQLHYPDLLLELTGGRRVAVELELSGKGRRRLDQIMFAYAGDGRLDGVLYLAPPGRIARDVRDAAGRAGISDTVKVQLLADGSPAGAPDPVGRSGATRRGSRQLALPGPTRDRKAAAR